MKTLKHHAKRIVENFYLVLILIFLYAPIVTMMVLSFNSSKSRTQWGGFTLQWYTQMFDSATIMDALVNTLLIAFVSALPPSTCPSQRFSISLFSSVPSICCSFVFRPTF